MKRPFGTGYVEYTVYGWTQVDVVETGYGQGYSVTSNVSARDAWKRAYSIHRELRKRAYNLHECYPMYCSWNWDMLQNDMIR